MLKVGIILVVVLFMAVNLVIVYVLQTKEKLNGKLGKVLLVIIYSVVGFLIIFLAKMSYNANKRLDDGEGAISIVEQKLIQDIMIVSGEEIYVPAYSSINSSDGKDMIDLSINLSIRNTDPNHSIILPLVDFYNTTGKINKKFIDNPIRIGPMATLNFHITQSDTIGGTGANFYLKWVSDTLVNEPVVEAIMLGSSGNQGYSWTSRGLVVKQIELCSNSDDSDVDQ